MAQERGRLAKRHLFVIRELLQSMASWDRVHPHVARFFEAAHQALSALNTISLQGKGFVLPVWSSFTVFVL